MGFSGEKHHINFHIHIPHLHFHHHHHHHHHHHGKKDGRNYIPKGFVGIMVGQGEEQERFVIPVIYVNHPLFMELLKEAEEEYGFDQQGPITIPCHVQDFRCIQDVINKEESLHHHHHHHHVWCFRV